MKGCPRMLRVFAVNPDCGDTPCCQLFRTQPIPEGCCGKVVVKLADCRLDSYRSGRFLSHKRRCAERQAPELGGCFVRETHRKKLGIAEVFTQHFHPNGDAVIGKTRWQAECG